MFEAAGILAVALLPLAAAAQTDARDSVELDPLVITAPVAPLDRELQRLRLMLDVTTPCLGCEAQSVSTRETIVTGLIRFMLFPAEPPPRDEARQVLGTVRCAQAGPGLENFCP